MNLAFTQLKPFGLLITAQDPESTLADLDIEQLRKAFAENHLIALRGFKPFESSEAFADYCEQWGEICLWPFGKVLELQQQENPDDHIFDHTYMPLHWDGMYRPQVPELQIFFCQQAPKETDGGRTTFSNTRMLLEQVSDETLATWTKVTGHYERKMEYYESKTIAPLICKHPERDYSVVRYCEITPESAEDFVNHPAIHFEGIPDAEANSFHEDLVRALYSPEVLYAHTWHTGDVVITDNYTLLHGREAFTSGSPRHLSRVQVLGTPPLNNPHLVSHL